MEAYMKLTVAAVILFTSVTTSFAGNFTPIPKNKVAQSCFATCQIQFQLCLSVCGNACVSTSLNRLPASRNCDLRPAKGAAYLRGAAD
jgi:hypothetical protein